MRNAEELENQADEELKRFLAEQEGKPIQDDESKDKKTEPEKGEKAKPANEEGNPPATETELELEQKRRKDAQAALTKKSQEVAELKRLNEQLQKSLAEAKNDDNRKPNQELEEDFPEIAEELRLLRDQVQQLANQNRYLSQYVDKQTKSIDESMSSEAQKTHVQLLEEAVPNFQQLIVTPEWQQWLDSQPSYAKRVAERGTTEEVIELLLSFKRQQGTPTDERLAAAKAVSTPSIRTGSSPDAKNTKRTFKSSEIAAMSMAEFEKLEAEIDLAYAEGRVTDD